MADDLVEERFTEFHPALPQRRLIGALRVPPEIGEIREHGCSGGFAVVVGIHHRDGATEQPPHLLPDAGVLLAAAAVDPKFPHELAQRFPRTSSRFPVLTTSPQIHDMSKRGRVPKGSLLSAPAIMWSE